MPMPRSGAFIMSLDFELRWRVRHRHANGAYDANPDRCASCYSAHTRGVR